MPGMRKCAYLAGGFGGGRLDQHDDVEPRRRQRRGPAFDIAAGRGERQRVIYGGTFDRIELGMLAGLPLQHPQQLVLIPAPAQHRPRPTRGLRIGGQMQVSERSRLDEMNLAIPRVRVDEFKRHGDPLPTLRTRPHGAARDWASRCSYRSPGARAAGCTPAHSDRSGPAETIPLRPSRRAIRRIRGRSRLGVRPTLSDQFAAAGGAAGCQATTSSGGGRSRAGVTGRQPGRVARN